MIGIKSYGVYIPYYRLNRAEVAKSWGGFQVPGDKAVANFDEDTVTMGVEACRECLEGFDKGDIDSLYLASTTFPYAEKQSSALVAAVLDCVQTALTVDISGTLRSGTNAVKLAIDSIKAESSKNALVCSSDLRLGLPKGAKELQFGDGAAALLIGDSDVVATIDNIYTVNNEIFDVYRLAQDRFVRSWEDRFVRDMGYTKVVSEAVRAALKAFNMGPEDFFKLLILCGV